MALPEAVIDGVPLDFHFLQHSSLLSACSAAAVVSVYRPWDRQPPRARRVVDALWSTPDTTLGRAISIVAASRGREARDRPRRRAVPCPDGVHYVGDDTAYAIYRIVPNEGPLSPSG
jgi:hypothetical protein